MQLMCWIVYPPQMYCYFKNGIGDARFSPDDLPEVFPKIISKKIALTRDLLKSTSTKAVSEVMTKVVIPILKNKISLFMP